MEVGFRCAVQHSHSSASAILLLLVAALAGSAGCTGDQGSDRRTAVGLDADGRVQLHYGLCPGERIHLVMVDELVGGSRTVPVFPSTG